MKIQIDSEKLKSLLRDFYNLTKMRIVVFDADIKEIASYPNHHSSYCQILRKNTTINEKCLHCDKEACTISLKKQATYTYRCHAGLVEAVSPILHENTVLGYIMLGQVLQTDDLKKSWEETAAYLGQFSLDLTRLKEAYFRKKNLSPDIINSASNIMKACSRYLFYAKMISLQNDDLEWKLDRYIRDHLSEELDAATLCTEFGISRNKLYEISELLYGCGVAEQVRNLRLNRARQLLESSDFPVSKIATLCGIPDYNYFTKVFKKHCGITPRDFRKKTTKK